MNIKGREKKNSNQTAENKIADNIIVLPDNFEQVGWLRVKLGEYEERKVTASMVAPEFVRFKKNDYKIAILRKLLDKGKVDLKKLALSLRVEESESFDPDKFQSATSIIREYCVPDHFHMYEGSNMVFAH